MRRVRAFVLVIVLLGACALVALPSATALEVAGGNIRLGKVPLGYAETFTRDVTNPDDEEVVVDATVTCDCPLYVEVEPVEFTLGPAATQRVTVRIDVPADADPGIHDTTVRFAPRTTGGGNVATGAVSFKVEFYPNTARLYIDPPFEPPTGFNARFVSSLDAAVDVTVTGDLAGPGVERPLGPTTQRTPGASNASTTWFPFAWETDDPDGAYTVRLVATWTDPVSGAAKTSEDTRRIIRGAPVLLHGFVAEARADGIRFAGTLENTGSERLEAWLVVEVQRTAGGPVVVESARVTLEGLASAPVETVWNEARAETYTVVAHAAFESSEGQTGTSERTAPRSVTGQGPGNDGDDGGRDGGSQLTLLALVALVGVGLGAAVAILINRRRGKA